MSPEVQQTLSAIESSVAGLTPEQLAQAPPGKWSAALVLEHLDLTFSGTVANMRKSLEKGPRVLRASWVQRMARWLVVDLGYFPRGVKAPETAVPKGQAGPDVLVQIREHLRQMDETIAECDARLGPQTTYKHPRLGPLTSAEWRRFHLIHTQHHMKQIHALRSRFSS